MNPNYFNNAYKAHDDFYNVDFKQISEESHWDIEESNEHVDKFYEKPPFEFKNSEPELYDKHNGTSAELMIFVVAIATILIVGFIFFLIICSNKKRKGRAMNSSES